MTINEQGSCMHSRRLFIVGKPHCLRRLITRTMVFYPADAAFHLMHQHPLALCDKTDQYLWNTPASLDVNVPMTVSNTLEKQ